MLPAQQQIGAIQARARLIEIPRTVLNIEDCEELAEIANQHPQVKGFLLGKNARRGDVAHFECCGDYRNDGRCMIGNNFELVSLCTDYIDYGTVPHEFEVINEFPCDYWVNAIAHNDVVYWYPSITLAIGEDGYEDEMDQIYDVILGTLTWISDLDGTMTYTHNGQTYTIRVGFDLVQSEVTPTFLAKRRDIVMKKICQGRFTASDVLGDGSIPPNPTTLYLTIDYGDFNPQQQFSCNGHKIVYIDEDFN